MTIRFQTISPPYQYEIQRIRCPLLKHHAESADSQGENLRHDHSGGWPGVHQDAYEWACFRRAHTEADQGCQEVEQLQVYENLINAHLRFIRWVHRFFAHASDYRLFYENSLAALTQKLVSGF